ncbi:hypothetical protein VOLCADRAFT_106870 [Volvox carteri f. nagariensis]|uniref:ABM domain-containing protein n=1 Tax=Volvox carteri f. nagariensis TaxID=3068 RepID=D8UAB5_VOLCA|nr:uncharacterized protein VOLCADRAFT_106870 [Volvox carteri f. nagariensis]EFJ43237.1 hypothetical protein VOLCADRAFT_106870 [Volvox carteri f. nagariensis]|eukprot:XP_002955597.1 hypothetical protein VOLCADRAFT_106870 [Volvox carteri f. nagariensis]
MARFLVTCLLLGALLGCALAARQTVLDSLSERMIGGDAQTIKWLQQILRTRGTNQGEEEENCAIIATKYNVPPYMRNDFIDAWLKVQDRTMKDEGLQVYDLKKTMGDNVFFWTYGEWESMDKFMDHLNADYMMDFLNFLDDKDVTWHMYPLKNVTDKSAMHSEVAEVSRKGKGKGVDPRDMNAHVVIEYHVLPSKVGEFIDAWKDCAAGTWDEEKNSLYSLRKVASMNHYFVAYGTWESYDAYVDHFMAKHTLKLREFLADNNIVWFSEPLMSMTETTGKM